MKRKSNSPFDEAYNDRDTMKHYHLWVARCAIKDLNKVSKVKYKLSKKAKSK